MPSDKQVAIPERHLGLVGPKEGGEGKDRFDRLAQVVLQHLDTEGLLKLARTATTPLANVVPKRQTTTTTCCIGVALDEAFHFYYHDNSDLLPEGGAELVYFSTIKDKHLPPDLDALYLGGGYPELHAQALQSNESLRMDIYSFRVAGGVVYAECGGLLYLCEALWTMTRREDGNDYVRECFEMCQVLPNVTARMTPHMKMYYAEVKMLENPNFEAGNSCRGQVFYFSEIDDDAAVSSFATSFLVIPQTPGAVPEAMGYIMNNVVARYFHLTGHHVRH